jgi:histone-lysine N-methyltransferase SETMAR
MSRSKTNVIFVVILDWKGIAFQEFVPRSQMVNNQLYQEVVARLRDAVRRKSPELWQNRTSMLHHENAPAHVSLLISRYLAKHQTYVVPHPPYSPDLAPADFFLFPKLKTTLKGRRFQTIEEIQENAIRELRAITQSAFQEAYQQGKERGDGVLPVEGTRLKGTVLKMLQNEQ